MPEGTAIGGDVLGGGYLVPRFGASTVLASSSSDAPTVEIVSPPAGTEIARDAPLIVDVTDDLSRLVRVILSARFFTNNAEVSREVVYDGGGAGHPFGPLYVAGSIVEAIPGGFRFTIVRTGGWPSRPRVRALAFDSHGQEAE